MDAYAKEHPETGKLIPPTDVLEAELDNCVEEKIRTTITERILREAGLEDQVAAAIAEIEKPTPAVLAEDTRCLFKREPERQWRDHIEATAEQLDRSWRDKTRT
jgi:hypothetical protein